MPSKTIVAIVAIATLIGIALFRGIDGAVLASGLSAIAGLGGYAIGKAKSRGQ